MNRSRVLALSTHLLALGTLMVGGVTGITALAHVATFALAGSLTNSIAIHLLFERVPGVAGSGVIVRRFGALRDAVANIVLTRLFTDEAISSVATQVKRNMNDSANPEQAPLADVLFDRLVKAIEASSLSGLLSMVGGVAALEPLRPHIEKEINEVLHDGDQPLLQINAEKLRGPIEAAVHERLAVLTPEEVRDILSDLIRNELGWLVVWGGVVGATMGIIWLIIADTAGNVLYTYTM